MAWLLDLFWSFLSSLGLEWANKHAKILFLGLDNAGKTTLMHMLKTETLRVSGPTQQPSSQELKVGNINFHAFDLGGHDVARRIWKDYYPNVGAIVFIVDAQDRARFAESAAELHKLLSDEALKDIPFLVLGNKIDLGRAASEEELKAELGIRTLMTGKAREDRAPPCGDVRPLELFMCSVVRRYGFGDGFKWLSGYIP